ncbi:hypothetical protein NFI96_003879, partial [Prochilodus magdalenae]
ESGDEKKEPKKLEAMNKQLRSVWLAGCKLTMNSCETLSAALKSTNSPLKELDLSNSDLQDSGVNLLSAGLKSSNCNLEILSPHLSPFLFWLRWEELKSLMALGTKDLLSLSVEVPATELASFVHDDGVQWVPIIIHNGEQFVQYPPHCHIHHRVQLHTNY